MRIEIRPIGLRVMRKNRGLTQRQLGNAISVSIHYISALEEGARRPGKDVQQRLINYFGCRFQDLFAVVLVDLETSEELPLALRSKRSR
jgi:transcriptional regulator with XRE-family HTH domain